MPVAEHPPQTTDTKSPTEASRSSDRRDFEDADYFSLIFVRS